MNDEIKLLEARARKYLQSAALLLDAEDYESSVSRSYYAMHFMVQAVLLKIGKTTSTHKGAISQFGEHFIKTGIFPKTAARALAVAFEKRQLGDYEAAMILGESDAESVLASSREIVEMLAVWLSQRTTD